MPVTPRAAGTLVLGLASLLAGCGPSVLETRLIQDTDDTGTGHEVQVLVRDPTGIARVDLLWAGTPNATPGDPVTPPGDLERRATTTAMVRLVDASNVDGNRYRGQVGAFPVGTRVFYAVRACNRLGTCAQDPPGWPQEAFSFVVGRLPSAPQVLRTEPARGPTSGGVRVAITGEDFRAGMEAAMDGIPCTFVEVVRPSLAYCTLPPGNAGPADVSVKNPDGQAATLRDGFLYFQAPRVLSVVPSTGPTHGGQAVSIRGEFFVEGARVTFQGRHARFVTVVSDAVITCETPPGNPGYADVAVLHPEAGEGVLPRGYRYIPPPRVNGVTPPQGPDFGGQQVAVDGENFEVGATVTVGGQPCVNAVVESPTLISCTVAPGTPGAADVEVTNPDGQQGMLAGGYYYNGPPVVLGVDPPEGPIAEGAQADVLGAGFLPGMTVLFDGMPAPVVNEGGRDRVTVRVPAARPPTNPAPDDGLRPVTVTVMNAPPDGRSASLERGYTYVWPPQPGGVAPPRGPTTGGTPVTITGRFFRPISGSVLTVAFDGIAATAVTVVSATEIQVVTPPGDPGPADVAVQNHPLSRGVGPALFLYVPPPRVDRVAPADGPTFGGDLVTISGAFFQPGASVTLDGAPCVGVTVAGDGTSLTCTTPAGERGPADVTVTNPDAQSGTLAAGYTYLGVVVRPGGGFEVGFTRTVIRAAGMQPGVRVFFGDTPATDVTVVSNRELVVQSPPHALGVVGVRFVNPDGTGDGAQAAFAYRTLRNMGGGGVMPNESATGNDGEVGDIDGDGDLDVVVGNGAVNGPETSVVYRNQLRPSGTFSFAMEDLPVNLIANQVSLGDVNGDGRPDLLVAASEGSALLRNDGTGHFTRDALGTLGDGAFEGVIADFNGDGVNDVFVLNIGCSNQASNPNCDANTVGRDTLLINNGNGTFQDQSALVPHDAAQVHDHKLEMVDLDGNGLKDLVIVVDNKNYAGLAGRPRHRVLLNFFPGVFEERNPPDLSSLVGDVYGIAMGDLDGDGRWDLVLPSYMPSGFGQLGEQSTPGSTAVFMGGAGVDFTRDDFRLDVGLLDEPTISTVVADLDGDGDLEILTVNLEGVSRIFVNRGNGNFVSAPTALPPVSMATTDMVAADFDNDGDVDVMMINFSQDVLLLAGP